MAIGRNGSGDYSGILFPYFWPGEPFPREYRLRRDHPEYTIDKGGKHKERDKYLSPPGKGNMLYFVPETPASSLANASLPIALVEGEKKTLALHRLAHHEALYPRFLPVGLSGVWNWRGTIGKTAGPDGDRRDVKGPIADLERLVWSGRKVFIFYDQDVKTNESVKAARLHLSRDLAGRGAEVFWVDLPDTPGGKGVDEFIAKEGPSAALALLESAPAADARRHFRNTDYGNAERLVSKYGVDLHFCSSWRKWLYWNNSRWIDATSEVVQMAKATVRSIYRESSDTQDQTGRKETAKWAHESEHASRIAAMMRLAESEPGIPVSPDNFDSDQWLLNVANGTVDLRTGQIHAHRREDLITKLAPVEYEPGAPCPRWIEFLEQIFDPHPDLIPFIQRAVGYSLTGDTREECLFLLYGTGRNGKGTFLKTIASVLGDHSGTADFITFTQRRDDSGPRDDVANMKGKRFVSAQEAREGAPLAESLIKWLTGGDVIRARRLYENSYEFQPTHKIWLATNHKPVIKGTDPAIWSRIKLIPFEVSFEGRENRSLKTVLMSELRGILAWAIEGCYKWRDAGLMFPESVTKATQEYRIESDQIERFIVDCCVRGDCGSAKAAVLYMAYKKWTEDSGEEQMSQKAFGTRLVECGFQREHTDRGNVYRGIGLRTNQTLMEGD